MKQAEYGQKIFLILSHVRIIVNNIRLYGLSHSQVEAQLRQLFKEFMEAFSVRPEITLLVIENDLIINNKAVPSHELKSFSLFINILQEKEIGFVTFRTGMKKSELRLFLEILAKPEKEAVQLLNSNFIQVGKVGLRKERGAAGRGVSGAVKDGPPASNLPGTERNIGNYQKDEIEQALSTLNSLASDRLDIVKEYYNKIQRFGHCDTREVESILSVFVDCFAKNMNPLAMLSVQKEADEYTFTHVVNVCILTLAQAAGLGFTGEQLLQIGVAASLHDVGKIFLSKNILTKTGRLSPAEREEIELHPAKGASYIFGLKGISRLAFLGALEHHMQYDGNGYPHTGGKWKTHIVSQMIAISDTFDAMRSNRVYQEAKPVELILGVLRGGKGTVFNPMLVDNFIRVIENQPQFT
jgi:HD-GYP domain-containing protein (c-di-GMP phosphodiesterase class II)